VADKGDVSPSLTVNARDAGVEEIVYYTRLAAGRTWENSSGVLRRAVMWAAR